MNGSQINGPLMLVAVLCALPVVGGLLLLFSGGDGSEALGFALVGFFGAGVFVLGRKALGRD